VFTRPFPNLAQVSALFIASGATGMVAATNLARAELKLQAADNFFMGTASGIPSGAAGPPGIFIASGQISPPITHTGPVYAVSQSTPSAPIITGATIPIRVWESSV
jgi:hypothetical protein